MIHLPFQFGDIYSVSKKACDMAEDKNEGVHFEFNEIELLATPTSNPSDIALIYNLQSTIRRLKAGYKD